MTNHSFDGQRVEEVSGVFDGSGKALRALKQIDREIHLSRSLLGNYGLGATSDRTWCLEELEGNLEQGIAHQVARHVELPNDSLERYVLVFERLDHGLTCTLQRFAECGIAAQIRPHDEGIHKASDKTFCAGEIAPRDRRAHNDLRLSRIAMQ